MLWLLRHGDAEDSAADDFSRRLTEKGERQARAAGLALARLEAKIDVCLTSPKLRSVETAEIAAGELGIEVEEVEALRGGDFEPYEVAAGRGNALLVGHEPDFSRAIQMLTGGRVELKKGGLAAVDGADLATLLRPRQLAEIAGIRGS